MRSEERGTVIIGLHAIGDLEPAKNYVVIWVDRI